MADKSVSEAIHRVRQFELVGRITELNSRHLKSEGRCGGLEVEIARCEEAIARGDCSEDFQATLVALRGELAEVERTRRDIEEERGRLNRALSEL